MNTTIVFDSDKWRIQKFVGYPKTFALDKKVRCDITNRRLHLVNVRWFDTENEAFDAMLKADQNF